LEISDVKSTEILAQFQWNFSTFQDFFK
jgi:hypothetical protein